MTLESLQLALQRIQEIRSRFEPPTLSGKPGTAENADFDIALFEAMSQANPSAAPAALDPLIQAQADRQGLDPNLLKAVIRTESNFNPNAVSSAGAQGLMQLMPGTARGLGVENSFDPVQNLMGGAKYLKGLLKKYDNSVPKALAAYNAGPGAVDRYGGIPPYAETTQYVKKVLSSYQAYQGGGQ